MTFSKLTARIMRFEVIVIRDTSDCEVAFYQETIENRMHCNTERELNKDLLGTSEF